MSLQKFAQLIEEYSGLQIPDYRTPDLHAALQTLAREQNVGSIAELHPFLQEPAGRGALRWLMSRVAIGETYFFRDRAQFAALEQTILPGLLHARRSRRSLRIWSAACSTGEEPYSLAVLLHRLLGEGHGWRLEILGTDLNRDALTVARAGRYRAWSFRSVAESFRQSYFQPDGDFLELLPFIRRYVTFQELNLNRDPLPWSTADGENGLFDLILCRNVLIYFEKATSAKLLRRIHARLAPGGYLLVGAAEQTPLMQEIFEPEPLGAATVFRRKTAQPEPQSPPVVLPLLSTIPPQAEPPTGWAAPQYEFSLPGPAARGTPSSPEALPALKAIPLSAEMPWQSCYRIAKALADANELAQADAWIELALAQAGMEAQLHYLRGVIAHSRGHTEQALAAYRRAIYLNPAFALAHFGQAVLFQSQGQIQRAGVALAAVARLLQGRPPEEPVWEGEDLTVGSLLEMALRQQETA